MSEEIDPFKLNVKLDDVDTSFPSLAIGPHQMVVDSYTLEPWSKDSSKSSLVITLKTINSETSTQGKDLQPGVLGFHRIAMQQDPHPMAPDFRIALAQFVEACYGEPTNLSKEALDGTIGKQVTVVYKAVKANADPQYGESQIGRIKAPIAV